MTYRPAFSPRVAVLLGVTASDVPTVICDDCGAVKRAITSRGGPPRWLLALRAPPGWWLKRTEREDGTIDRRDLCPRCRP